ncbi:MAG: dihydrodipicolinate reductase C-terminal domain-containing protein, partial [Chlamydiota bacterium]
PCDTITLKHEARSREGFALGAVIAAEWLQDKKGFFTMEDLMEDYA